MQHIIIDKKKYNDKDIVFQSISEDNRFYLFCIPGILKSKKRSSYFLVLGSIWKFEFSSNHFKYIIPKEMECKYYPYNQRVEYTELKKLQEMLSPITVFSDHNDIELFDTIKKILLQWRDSSINKKKYLINKFSLILLKNLGILDFDPTCKKCNTVIANQKSILQIGIGNLCQECTAQNNFNIKINIPNTWIQKHIESFSKEYDYSSEYSSLINQYILKNYKH